MATANRRVLTLTTVNDKVTVKVTYNAVFTPFERHLANNGLIFQEKITVKGWDGPNPTQRQVLRSFPRFNFPVTSGAGNQIIPRTTEMVMTRASLQEDPGTSGGRSDTDEIICSIEILPIGMPRDFSGETNEVDLLG